MIKGPVRWFDAFDFAAFERSFLAVKERAFAGDPAIKAFEYTVEDGVAEFVVDWAGRGPECTRCMIPERRP